MKREAPSSSVKSNLEDVRLRLRRVCHDLGRAPETVELICVTKGVGSESIRAALDAGEIAFGENRVQEAKEKWPELRTNHPNVSLHLIGPLQSNKVGDAVALFDVIETIDRPKIALAVAQAGKKHGRTPKCYIQVNTGDENQKAGVSPHDLGPLVRYCRELAALEIDGLMCIPPVDQQASPHFSLLNQLARQFELRELSMGMSGDFELAIQLGATKIRVGSAIFGERRKKTLPTIT